MILRKAGGTAEGDSVPEVANPGVSISLKYFRGDGSVCSVHIDDVERGVQIDASEQLGQCSIVLQGVGWSSAPHRVEIVAMDGDAVIVYKNANYKITDKPWGFRLTRHLLPSRGSAGWQR